MACTRAISPNYQPAPKDAGFHVVQTLLLLTRHLPLNTQ
ncbi:PTS cellbiose transporter subunit IIC [Streptococcus sp. UMB0029]|nr:PTS cellbiose transporter subunit IIC [Streptococcus sp. UMB0029]